MQPDFMAEKKQHAFTLLEVLFVIAIIAILAAVALPAYNDYSKGAKFAEVVAATMPYKLAIETIAHTQTCAKPLTLQVMNAGSCGIPPAVAITKGAVASITVIDGEIIATGVPDLLDSQFILTPDGVTPPITWTASGSCFTNNFCN
jgi:type IV pilus assembly protein PilA